MTRVNIDIRDEIHKKAKLYSVMQNKTLSDYINESLKEKVEKDEKKGK